MTKLPDPTQDLYQIMTEAGLDATNVYDTRRSMHKIINDVRTRLAADLKQYIEKRERYLTNEPKEGNQ